VRVPDRDGGSPVRRRARVRNDAPEAVQRWRAAHRLKRYGLTQESFERLLEAQGHACAMCFEPFQDDEPIHIDHDHDLGCHPEEKRACDRCRRGLLHLKCNTAVGYIEKYTELARPYLDRFAAPPAA
jgi:recombination endonuclease VII